MLSSTKHQQKPPKHDHELGLLSSFEMHQQKTPRDDDEPNLLSSTEHQQKTLKDDHEPKLVIVFCRIWRLKR